MASYMSCQTTFRVLYPSVETKFDNRYQVVRRGSAEGHQVGRWYCRCEVWWSIKTFRIGSSGDRRLRSGLTETYKIVKGNYSINRDLFLDIDDMGLRGHESKLFKRRFRLDVRKFVFSNSWNSLSAECVNCNTVDTFEKYVSIALGSETDVNWWLC